MSKPGDLSRNYFKRVPFELVVHQLTVAEKNEIERKLDRTKDRMSKPGHSNWDWLKYLAGDDSGGFKSITVWGVYAGHGDFMSEFKKWLVEALDKDDPRIKFTTMHGSDSRDLQDFAAYCPQHGWHCHTDQHRRYGCFDFEDGKTPVCSSRVGKIVGRVPGKPDRSPRAAQRPPF